MSFSDKLAIVSIVQSFVFGILSLAGCIAIPLWIYKRQRQDAIDLASRASQTPSSIPSPVAKKQGFRLPEKASRNLGRLLNVLALLLQCWSVWAMVHDTGPLNRLSVLAISIGVACAISLVFSLVFFEAARAALAVIGPSLDRSDRLFAAMEAAAKQGPAPVPVAPVAAPPAAPAALATVSAVQSRPKPSNRPVKKP